MGQYLKLSWMFTWRFWVLTAFMLGTPSVKFSLLFGFIVAAILQFGFGRNIKTFPIIRLLTLHNPIFRTRQNVHGERIKTATIDGLNPFAQLPVIDKPSQPGQISGFEPRFLNKVIIPATPMMYGTPGKSLTHAYNMTSTNIRTGQMGETNFAKALTITTPNLTIDYNAQNGMINNITSFWSVAMPNHTFTAKDTLNTDIDSIFVNNQEIVLIDQKFYKSGNVTYTSYGNQLYCIDNKTGAVVGDPKKMSKNMEIALERFTKSFPKMRVSAMVVLIPTDMGSATIDNVYWPGKIQAVNIETALAKISSMTQTTLHAPYDVIQKISKFVA